MSYTQTFDTQNRLTSILVSGQNTQFLYDPDGNLVEKIKPDGRKTIYVGGATLAPGAQLSWPLRAAPVLTHGVTAEGVPGSAVKCMCAHW